jgi:hypothetical protein
MHECPIPFGLHYCPPAALSCIKSRPMGIGDSYMVLCGRYLYSLTDTVLYYNIMTFYLLFSRDYSQILQRCKKLYREICPMTSTHRKLSLTCCRKLSLTCFRKLSLTCFRKLSQREREKGKESEREREKERMRKKIVRERKLY